MCSCKLFNNLLPRSSFQIDKWKLRTLCQVVVEEKPKEKRKPSKTHLKQLNTYLSSTPQLLKIKNKLPDKCLKKTRRLPDDLYLVDNNIGKKIANSIINDIKQSNAIVVETNPGFGFITEQLLKKGIPKILAYEPTVAFRDNLFSLDVQYPNRLKIYNKDFFSIWKLSYQDKYDNGNRVKNMLSGIETKEWDSDIAMNIIGVLSNPNFIRHLILSTIFQYGIMTWGRSNLYICIPPFLYLQWTAQPSDGFQIYRPTSVLLQMFCDFTIMDKVHRKTFLPWDSMLELKMNNKIRYEHYLKDAEYMYLTKISFKPLPVTVDKLQPLWHFVRHLMVSRKSRIIPMLEKWIPGCGWHLIVSSSEIIPNMNIYTRIGDLKPHQILHLFKLFISWPEYTESSFLASMETALLKMEQSSDDHLDSNIKDDEKIHEGHHEHEKNENKKTDNVQR